MAKHSKYSPSKSYLWLNCPASLGLLDQDEKSSDAADRGARLHEVMEEHVKKYGFDPNKKPDKRKIKDDDADRIVETYIKFSQWLGKLFQGHDMRIKLEERVKMENIIPGCFGTSDIVIRIPSMRTIVIADWKFGRVEVSPTSSQLFLYMIGAVGRDSYDNFINVILQPKSRHRLDSYAYDQKEYNKIFKKYKKDAGRNLLKKPRATVGPWCDHWASCRKRCTSYRKTKIAEARDSMERLMGLSE